MLLIYSMCFKVLLCYVIGRTVELFTRTALIYMSQCPPLHLTVQSPGLIVMSLNVSFTK